MVSLRLKRNILFYTIAFYPKSHVPKKYYATLECHPYFPKYKRPKIIT